MLKADYQVFELLNLLRLSLSTMWPALALAAAVSALSLGNVLAVFPERYPTLSRWSRSDGVLIAWPVYLWGALAAWNLLLLLDVQGDVVWQSYCAFALSQFVGLALLMAVVGLRSVFHRCEESQRGSALVGPLLAVSAVAIDYVVFLTLVVLAVLRG